MRTRHFLLIALLLTLALVVAGCAETPVEELIPTPAPVETPVEPDEAPAELQLTPGPLGQMPAGKAISVSAVKDPIKNEIRVQFDGGEGMTFVTRIDVTMYASDGRIEEQSIERPLARGKSITFTGTRGVDRIKATAYYMTGEVVVVYDRIHVREL
ncbi:MAG: hypothetical protein D5R99_07755 [Methanocalculus sp. MSAO_Arc1]|uniref:hypothetical protein n=1 Tax=Methanocalculus TaxID=71151 RepID=UPI000FF40451|nr:MULTISPECIES: hypothetical protein [unclassified Methanocalculus]MCP1662015.1 hypothetical protein [Methanocalculus sp. AMF5]RQD79619.1 MAG: hypothetical protein D5R99_07755 [Methanocalculus sp. MSAO_Arc1]